MESDLADRERIRGVILLISKIQQLSTRYNVLFNRANSRRNKRLIRVYSITTHPSSSKSNSYTVQYITPSQNFELFYTIKFSPSRIRSVPNSPILLKNHSNVFLLVNKSRVSQSFSREKIEFSLEFFGYYTPDFARIQFLN